MSFSGAPCRPDWIPLPFDPAIFPNSLRQLEAVPTRLMPWRLVAEAVEQRVPWALEPLATIVFLFCGTCWSLFLPLLTSGLTPFGRILTCDSFPVSDGLFLCFFPFFLSDWTLGGLFFSFFLIDVLFLTVDLRLDVHLLQEVPLFLPSMMQQRQVLLAVVHLERNPSRPVAPSIPHSRPSAG